MIRMALLFAAIYVAAVLESSLADVAQVGSVTPDLLALVAAMWVIGRADSRRFLAAGVAGLAGDLLGPGPIGPGAAVFLAAGYAVVRLCGRWSWQSVPARVAGVLIFTAAVQWALGSVLWISGQAAVRWPQAAWHALGVAVYTAGVSVPVWMVVSWFGVRRGSRPRMANG